MEKLIISENVIPGRRAAARRVQLICEDPSLTKQSFTKSSDIREMLVKYAKTGILGDPSRTPIFGDFSRTDFVESMNLVASVKSQFENLPVVIRDRFQNDPAEMLEFLADEKNNDEAVRLGLRKAPEPHTIKDDPSHVTPPTPAKESATPTA